MTIHLKKLLTPIAFLSLGLCFIQPLWADFIVENQTQSPLYCVLHSDVRDCYAYSTGQHSQIFPGQARNPFIPLVNPDDP